MEEDDDGKIYAGGVRGALNATDSEFRSGQESKPILLYLSIIIVSVIIIVLLVYALYSYFGDSSYKSEEPILSEKIKKGLNKDLNRQI